MLNCPWHYSDTFMNPKAILSSILSNKNMMIYPKDKGTVLEKYRDNYNIKDSYEYSKDKYIKSKEKTTTIHNAER